VTFSPSFFRMNAQLDEKFYWLALKLVPGVGAKTFLRLLERFGEPEKVFRAKRESLAQVKGITKKAVDNIVLKKFEKDPEKELEDTSRKGIKIICLKDSEYPKNLAQIHDPPPVLFVKGDRRWQDSGSFGVWTRY